MYQSLEDEEQGDRFYIVDPHKKWRALATPNTRRKWTGNLGKTEGTGKIEFKKEKYPGSGRRMCGYALMVMVAFSSRARILEECSTIHYPPVLFFFKAKISSHTLIPLFRPGPILGGSAS